MSITSIEYKVQYNIVFKGDGTVEGSGSCAEGHFTINGMCNLHSGAVAWHQAPGSCPVWYNPCVKYGAKIEAEFYGEMRNLTGPGPAQITGTFLTEIGRYCAVNLTCSEAETGTSIRRPGLKSAEVKALPALLTTRLTGKWMPITDKAGNRKRFLKQCTNTSDTYHSWEDDSDEDDDKEHFQK